MFKIGGHRPDPIGLEYKSFDKSILSGMVLPNEADLRQFSSPRHNQKNTNSCVAQSTIKALEIKRIQKHGVSSHIPLSVLDLYFGARDLMSPKETNVDSGTNIYLACDVLQRFGVCREQMFPFDERNLFIPSPILATREAYLNKIVDSFKIISTGNDRVDDVIANLQAGNPVVFGTVVGANWFNYTSNSKPLDVVASQDIKGSHATCLVGWVNNLFITENSWSETWGDNGYGWLRPEVIASDQSSDFWVILDGSEVFYENMLK